MARCPNCDSRISWDSTRCGSCSAVFSEDSAWRPIPDSTDETRKLRRRFPVPVNHVGDNVVRAFAAFLIGAIIFPILIGLMFLVPPFGFLIASLGIVIANHWNPFVVLAIVSCLIGAIVAGITFAINHNAPNPTIDTDAQKS